MAPLEYLRAFWPKSGKFLEVEKVKPGSSPRNWDELGYLGNNSLVGSGDLALLPSSRSLSEEFNKTSQDARG